MLWYLAKHFISMGCSSQVIDTEILKIALTYQIKDGTMEVYFFPKMWYRNAIWCLLLGHRCHFTLLSGSTT